MNIDGPIFESKQQYDIMIASIQKYFKNNPLPEQGKIIPDGDLKLQPKPKPTAVIFDSDYAPRPSIHRWNRDNGDYTAFGDFPLVMKCKNDEQGRFVGGYMLGGTLVCDDDLRKQFETMKFDTREEADAFAMSLALNCAAYSFETEQDRVARTDPKVLEELKGAISKYWSRAEEEMSCYPITANREVKFQDGKVCLMVGNQEMPWLNDEVAKERIKQQLGTTLEIPMCGRRIMTKLHETLLKDDLAPSVNAEQIESLSNYMNNDYRVINNLMWSNYGGIDLGVLECIEQAVTDVLNISDVMKPLDKDLKLHRRAKKFQYEKNIPLESSVAKREFDDQTVDLCGLTSTSVDMDGTRHFGGDLRFEIDIPKGTPVAWVGLLHNEIQVHSAAFENEVLLPPMNYRVQAVEGHGSVVKLDDPKPLDIEAILLRSLAKIRDNNKDNQEIIRRVDALAGKVKQRVLEKHDGIVPEQCKGAYTNPSRVETLEENLEQIQSYLKSIGMNMDDLKFDSDLMYNSKHEDTHSESHIKRVVMLGTLLAAKENIERQDFKTLLAALKYHDIGRADIKGSYKDGVSDEHGQYSAERIRKHYNEGRISRDEIPGEPELNTVCDAVSLHSLPDTHLNVCKNSNRHLYIIASLLKDADNLDRVRLGDLDPKYLRNPSAKTLVPFAHQLFGEYQKQKVSKETQSEQTM